MPRYFKLGVKASCFNDPTTKTFMGNPLTPLAYEGNISRRISEGLKGGAIVEIKEAEFNDMNKAFDEKHGAPATETAAPDTGNKKETGEDKKKAKADLKAKLSAMTDEELLAYYNEEFDVNKEEEEEFMEMTTKEKVKFLLD